MPIVSSSYTVGPQEVCGRYWVKEKHADDLGAVHIREYMGSGQDYAVLLTAHALEINEHLASDEAGAVIGGT